MLSIIAAHTSNQVIGIKGELPWKKLRSDLQRFKELTSGHPVIMGRKTWESLPESFRPLPGRNNIVISRDNDYVAPGALVFSSLDEAISHAATLPGGEETFVIGGAQIYALALPLADKVYLTVVDMRAREDALFPAMDDDKWKVMARSSFRKNADNDFDGVFIDYLRTHA